MPLFSFVLQRTGNSGEEKDGQSLANDRVIHYLCRDNGTRAEKNYSYNFENFSYNSQRTDRRDGATEYKHTYKLIPKRKTWITF